MTFLQEDMIRNIDTFVDNVHDSLEKHGINEAFGDYEEEYTTWKWTMRTLKNEIIDSDVDPLTVVKKFQNEMKRCAKKNPIFYYSVNAIDEFLLTIL